MYVTAPVVRAGQVLTTLGLCAGLTLVGPLPGPATAAGPGTFTVTSAGDQPDAAPQDGVCLTSVGTCTLRAALTTANNYAGHATVEFAVSGPTPVAIAPASKLPLLSNPAGTTLDGFTQPGSAANTDPLADNSVPGVELRGKTASGFDGLVLTSGGNVVRGLAIYDFAKAIALNGAAADNNQIVGNHVCTNAAGTFRTPGVNTAGLGILLTTGADHNALGAPGPQNRNVISGCAHRGVVMSFSGTRFNLVQNNIIGLNPAGTAALGNRSHGADVNYTSDNTIGGDGFQERNVISGNAGTGIEISHSRNTQRNLVVGNLIGTDLTGATAPAYAANGQWGVRLEGPKQCLDADAQAVPCTEADVPEGLPGFNTIRNNVVVNNAKGGMLIDKGQHDNVVRDNKIGVTATGTPAANPVFAIRLERGAYRNTIGPGNEIAYNAKGVTLAPNGYAPPGPAQRTYDNRITANSIHDNTGSGIDLAPFGQVNAGSTNDPLVNDGMVVPVLTGGTPTTVTGTTCASCSIEVYIADTTKLTSYGEGVTLLGTGTATSGGTFTVTIASSPGAVVSAIATNPTGGSSEFAKNIKLPTA